MTFDVAVIGAGLAGLQCARLLAGRGLSVALIDRKASLAAPVHTTGIFVRKTWEDFDLPVEQLGPGIRNVYLHSPSGATLHLEASHDEFRLGRMEWIYAFLLDECSRAGVRWFPETEVLARATTGTGTQLTLSKRRTIVARYVVGADGARSATARRFGLDSNHELLVGLEDIVAAPDRPPSLHCYLNPRLAPGYIAWVASDGSQAHIGVAGYRDRFVPAKALAEFRSIAGLQHAKTIERRGGLIPVNGPLRRIASLHALLVGDAAGAVSPLTAGGLDGALRLSAHAAKVIAAYLATSDPAVLAAYDGAKFQSRFFTRRWMRRILKSVQHPLLADAAVTMLSISPFRALAAHVFFSRGSFPDPPPLAVSGRQSAIASAQ
jgi:flavin-dependent dehydrogenase